MSSPSALELARRGLACAYVPAVVARLHNAHARPASKLVPVLAAASAQTTRTPHLVTSTLSPDQALTHRVLVGVNRVLE